MRPLIIFGPPASPAPRPAANTAHCGRCASGVRRPSASAVLSSSWRRLWFGLALAFVLTRPARAVELESHRWGWNDRVVVDHFNVLTLWLRNDDDSAFEGAVEVFPGRALGATGFPVIFPELFIAPYATRTVQFPLFVRQPGEYTVRILDRYGNPVARFSLNAPRAGPPAVVQFLAASDVRSGVGLPAFPVELFPPNFAPVYGTLRVVVLDFAPRWTAAQRQAFQDWLHSGGTLHLYRGQDGRFPEFPGSLSVLNGDAPFARIGSGAVFRHAKTLVEAREDWQQAQRMPGWKAAFENGTDLVTRPDWLRADSHIFFNLRRQTVPKINWNAVLSVLVVYTALIFPGVRLLLRGRDYRLSLLAVVLLSLGATFAIYVIGRRGYGESAAIHAVVIARQTQPGEYLADARTSVFVTAAGRRTLRASTSEAAYGPSDEQGSLFGRTVIFAGSRPAIQSTIPLFSSFTFRHAYRTTQGPRWRLRVEADRPASLLTAAKPQEELLFHLQGPPIRPTWVVATVGTRYIACQPTARPNVFRPGANSLPLRASLSQQFQNWRSFGQSMPRLNTLPLLTLDYTDVLWAQALAPRVGKVATPRPAVSLYFACDLSDQPWKDAFLLENRDLGRQQVTVIFRVDPAEFSFASP